MSEKIKPHHLARKAVLYIRQSSPQQVVHNEESRRLQYAMEERVRRLGWSEVEVLDEDQGCSAGGGVQRTGFQGMVAEVCLGKVGGVAAREVSRFARNSRDWQQLVEVCRVVDTLLIDHEAIYDPRRGNDRLLLGLKGSLNEYELDLLRHRSVEARREKARRGELIITAPAGYIKTDDQRLEKDPDRRVQESVGMVFRKFLELGTVRQTLLWLLEHGLELPTPRHGVSGWETHWKRPSYAMVLRILRSPVYGGTYAYGKTKVGSEYRNGVPFKFRRRRPREDWLALIPNHHEGYIAWEQFERIQEMISKNLPGTNAAGPGAAKKGPALLVGLLRCRRCSRKLTVKYTGRCHDVARYACARGSLDHAEPRCIEFGGRTVDETVSKEVLRVIQPGAIEAAVQAGLEETQQRDDVLEALSLELKAARYAAERAWKQYDAGDPENRLVADQLEHRWNVALERVEELERRIEDEQAGRARVMPPAPEDLESLAADLVSVWNHPDADVRLKKRIVRTLIEEILADVDSVAGEIKLLIHWKGGIHTEVRLPRRRRGQNSSQTSKEVVEAVRTLALICSDNVIAGFLNRNGLRTGRGNRWTRERVTSLRTYYKIARHSAERQKTEGWMHLTEAATHVGVSPKTLRRAVEQGEVKAEHPLPDGPWVFKHEDLRQPGAQLLYDRARRLHQNPAGPALKKPSLFPPTT